MTVSPTAIDTRAVIRAQVTQGDSAGPAWSETQTWDTSERVATAAGVPNRSPGPHRR